MSVAIEALFCIILGLGPKGPSHIPSIRSNPQVAPNDRMKYLDTDHQNLRLTKWPFYDHFWHFVS